MSLTPGTRLAHYDIVEPIGKGGMGEVYRAKDTKLGREVAIKVLPDEFAQDEERLKRFQREAQVLASLNHPGIAAIYGVEHDEDTHYLVLELVPGETLADRIARGPIPVEEALDVAVKIAEALEEAHEQGIVHRDLKPANIKLTPDDKVKVLDFGLAKALEEDVPGRDDSMSPTITRGTQVGVILGTAAYMSPEQAKGKKVDRRTDIFAFGAVLYEMLTGKRAFHGDGVSDVLAAVLKEEPDWAKLPAASPERLVRRCLAKSLRERFQHIGDVAFELREPIRPARPAREVRPWVRVLFPAATVLAALAFAWAAIQPGPKPVTRSSIVIPPEHVRTGLEGRGVAISPSGSHVTYVANDQLYVRRLDELEARPLAGTEGSYPLSPVFSPDGEWIAFFSSRDDALQRVRVTGGPAETVTNLGVDVNQVYGASWGEGDTIVYGEIFKGVVSVPGSGGTPEVLVEITTNPPTPHRPQILPDGEAVLYTLGAYPLGWDNAEIVVADLASGKRTVLLEGRDARYLPTGHLVFARGGDLFAAALDLQRVELRGTPIPLVEGISTAGFSGDVNVDFSQEGTMVYLPGGAMGGITRSLLWVDREGAEEPIAAPPQAYVYPRLSPDGTSVALDNRDQDDDIWVWNLEREVPRRLTFAAARDWYPVWTPDGERVVFTSFRESAEGALYWRAADGTGEPEPLVDTPSTAIAHDVSPDGKYVVFGDYLDLFLLTLDEPREVTPFLVTDSTERNAVISPDGRWLAYESDESGQFEVWGSAVSRRGERALADLHDRRNAPSLDARWPRAALSVR